jgi:hypothetical protein
MILDGDERENVDTENVALDMEIKMIGNIKDRSLIVKNNLIIEFNSYMKAIGNEPSDDSESYENMIQGLLEQGAKTKSVSVCGLDNDLQNVLKVMADSRDEQISVLVNSVLASWGPLGGNLPDINIESGRCLILQISFLRVEVLRLKRILETTIDLKSQDCQLVKHISDMESYEAASKLNRKDILKGNSRYLQDEEKYRSLSKKTYMQITERMIAVAAVLEGLVASSDTNAGGGGSPTTPLAGIFSCLSSQGQALLRGSWLA